MCLGIICPQVVPKGISTFIASNIRLWCSYIETFLSKSDDKRNAGKVSVMLYWFEQCLEYIKRTQGKVGQQRGWKVR